MSTSHGVEFIEELGEDDQKISYENGVITIEDGGSLDFTNGAATSVFGTFLGYFLPGGIINGS